MPEPAVEGNPSRSRAGFRVATVSLVGRFWAYLFLGGLVAYFSVAASGFATVDTTQTILLAATIPLTAALGQTFVVISGGIDLSVAFTVGMAAVVSAIVVKKFDAWSVPVPLAILAAALVALGAAGCAGLVNGVLVAVLRIPPFIATLGTYGIARGVAFLMSGGPPVANLPDAVATIGNSYVVGAGHGSVKFFQEPGAVGYRTYLPTVVAGTVALVAAMTFVLAKTRFGQHIYAIGGSAEASRRAGVPVRRRLIQTYVLSALLAGCAGLIFTLRFQAGAAQAGEPILIDELAAIVIGGASLFGGTGTILGTVVGALVIAVIETGLILINVDPFWQFIAVGAVIVVAVAVDQARSGVVERLLRTESGAAGGS